MLSGIRIQVNDDSREEEEDEDDEYKVESGRGCSSHRSDQECGFGITIKHPEVGQVRDFPFAINQPVEGLVFIRIENGFMAFNRKEKKNINVKIGKENEIVLQPDDSIMFKLTKPSTFKDWAVGVKGSWKSLESSLKDLFSKTNQSPPQDAYQLRVNLQPDVHALRLRIGSTVTKPQRFSFEFSCSKLPEKQTWYLGIKLTTIIQNVLLLEEPRRTLLLNQTKNDIQLEKSGTFYVINSRGTGMFEGLTSKNISGYAIHVSGKKVEVSEAIKLLAKDRKRESVPTAASFNSEGSSFTTSSNPSSSIGAGSSYDERR